MTFLGERISRTKKPRKCDGCLETWPIGTTFRHVKYIDDGGDFDTSARCPVCDAYLSKHPDDFEDGYGPGELKEYDQDGWESLRQELGVTPETAEKPI